MEPFGAKRILSLHRMVSIVIGKFLIQTTTLMLYHTFALKITKLAKLLGMKVFIYIQESNSQKMILLNYQIKNYTQQLKKNLPDFLAQVIRHLHLNL